MAEAGFSHVATENCVMPGKAEGEKVHYVVIFMRHDLPDRSADAVNTEPDKNEGWTWVPVHQAGTLSPMFLPLRQLLDNGYQL